MGEHMSLLEVAIRDACDENGWLATDPRVWNMVQHIQRALPQADQSPKGRNAKRFDAQHASGGPEGMRTEPYMPTAEMTDDMLIDIGGEVITCGELQRRRAESAAENAPPVPPKGDA
jgi:hypothetical protein